MFIMFVRRYSSRSAWHGALAIVVGALLMTTTAAACSEVTPTEGPAPTPTTTPTPSPSPLPTGTATVIPTPAATATPSPTPTPRPTVTPVPTPTATPTPSPVPTPAPRPTPTPAPHLPNFGGDVDWFRYRLGQIYGFNPDRLRKHDEAIRALPWIADGIDAIELQGLEGLLGLANEDEDTFSFVMEQPWIEDERFFPALQSLALLAYTGHYDELETIRSHPAIRDGISEDEVAILATLFGVVAQEFKPEMIDTLLGGDARVEKRTFTTPLSDDLSIYIIRTQPGMDRTMDLIEQSVRVQEEFMDIPWPSKSIIYLFSDRFSFSTSLPTKSASLVSPIYESPDIELDRVLRMAAFHSGGAYWHAGEIWVDAGGSYLAVAIALQDEFGWPVEPRFGLCPHDESLREDISCYNHSGSRLFLDLYYQLGEKRTRDALKRMYFQSLYIEDVASHCSSFRWEGFCQLEAAFMHGATSQEAAIVEQVTRRWYSGVVSFESRPHSLEDTTPVEPLDANVGITIDDIWVSGEPDGEPVDSFPVSDIPVNQTESLYLGLDYTLDSSARDSDLQLEVVLFAREDGFTYGRRHVTLDIDPDYGSHQTASFRLGTRYWIAGRAGEHAVYVYHEGVKIGEIPFDVVP